MKDWLPSIKSWIHGRVTLNYTGKVSLICLITDTFSYESFSYESFSLSHPVGLDGQNHIMAVTPLKFLPPKEFQKRQKSIDSDKKLAIMASIPKIAAEVIEKKNKARDLKEKGNVAFMKKKFEEAEMFYSEAIQLNIGYRPFWTNRAKCRNVMKKYQDAISDCDSALSINPKCTKSITEKGNALLGLERFAKAKECYESLRSLGEDASVENLLKKLHDVQETDF